MDRGKIEEVKKKLQEINDIVCGYDPEIRAGAFDILAWYYFGDEMPKLGRSPGPPGQVEQPGTQGDVINMDDLEKFVRSFDHSKPSDNIHAIAAWYYSQYGLVPIARKTVEDAATKASVTVPSRPDNTMKQASKGGKKYYQQGSKGFKLTVSGEKFLQQTYDVIKGNKPYS